ncbi:MAG: ATP-dependent Clp protease ATP-binding subunit ClpC [Actinomycetota bacterium]|jgi:ATP-dependent Clp protease ATP-binding subunit ClpA
MFERFTERTRGVLVRAEQLTKEFQSPAIRRHHVLIALLDSADDGSGSVAAVLDDAGVDRAALRAELVASLKASETPTEAGRRNPPFTAETKKTLELSLREALSLGHNYIGREHLLLGVLRDMGGPLADVVATTNLTYARAREIVTEQSPPSGRGSRRRMIRESIRGPLGRRSTPALGSVLRRTFDRAQDRNATTGDLLIALLETEGTHFAAAFTGLTLPPLEPATLYVDKLIADNVPDGVEGAIRLERDAITINDPQIASEIRRLVGDKVTPEKLEEILRRLKG